MTTLKGHNFLVYFANTNDEDKVRCKLCNRNLKSKRLFNLKKHLKMLHQLEVIKINAKTFCIIVYKKILCLLLEK